MEKNSRVDLFDPRELRFLQEAGVTSAELQYLREIKKDEDYEV